MNRSARISSSAPLLGISTRSRLGERLLATLRLVTRHLATLQQATLATRHRLPIRQLAIPQAAILAIRHRLAILQLAATRLPAILQPVRLQAPTLMADLWTHTRDLATHTADRQRLFRTTGLLRVTLLTAIRQLDLTHRQVLRQAPTHTVVPLIRMALAGLGRTDEKGAECLLTRASDLLEPGSHNPSDRLVMAK